VKQDIAEHLLQDRLGEEIIGLANAVDDRLAGGEPLEDVAKSLHLEIKSLGPLHADGSTPDSKDGVTGYKPDDAALILETGFSLNEGEVSAVVELGDGSYAALRADKVVDQTYQPFQEVRAEIEKEWTKNYQARENRARADSLLDALRKGEKTLAASGHEVKKATVSRAEKASAPITEETKTEAFDIDDGNFFMGSGDKGYIIGFVDSVHLPEPPEAEESGLKEIQDTLVRSNRDEVMQTFVAHLYDKYKVRVNEHLLSSTYGPENETN
jgi:peptidyl-prolyl cis-trans isomerase D